MREYVFAITGATGLVGSHMVEHLISSGYTVHSFSGNINNRDQVESFVFNSKPDFFIHLAGYTDTKRAYDDQYNVFSTNVLGTLNVLDALSEYGKLKSVAVISSDRAEHDPNSPYGASKLAMERIAKSYGDSGLPISVIRFGNIYGPRDYNLHRFIPRIMYSYAYDVPLELTNMGTDMRGYIHVIDAVRAILIALQNRVDSVIEIKPIRVYSNLSIVKKISSLLSHDIKYVLTGDANIAILDTAVPKNIIGWKQTIDIDLGLSQTIQWYKNMYKELDII